MSVGVRSETPFVLVESWSDRQPPVFLLFNQKTGKLSLCGESRPAIAGSTGGRSLAHQFTMPVPRPSW
jgi:hypothetical protein